MIIQTIKNKFISSFNFIDTEKINRIDIFLKNNSKQVEIICTENIKEILKRELLGANYKVIDLDEFIEKRLEYMTKN